MAIFKPINNIRLLNVLYKFKIKIIINKKGRDMGYIKKEFGKNLRVVRTARKLTQGALADMVGIDQKQLSRIENGDSFATAETIEKLCHYLDVPVGVLFNIQPVEIPKDENAMIALADYKKNFDQLSKEFAKVSLNSNTTEFVCLAMLALENHEARKRLKSILHGMDLMVQPASRVKADY